MQLTELMHEVGALRDPAVLEVDARHGDEHAVKLGELRALAKRIKKDQDLARELWTTGDPTRGCSGRSARILRATTSRRAGHR